jgi:hypothetical protein
VAHIKIVVALVQPDTEKYVPRADTQRNLSHVYKQMHTPFSCHVYLGSIAARVDNKCAWSEESPYRVISGV